jgi:putative ABC transport system substrate-binding protein
MAAELQGKCVELLHDMLPFVRRVAALGYAADPFSKPFVDQVQLAGRATGNEINPIIMLNGPDEIFAAFVAKEKARADAVVSGGTLSTKHIADLALKHRLPAATNHRLVSAYGVVCAQGLAG